MLLKFSLGKHHAGGSKCFNHWRIEKSLQVFFLTYIYIYSGQSEFLWRGRSSLLCREFPICLRSATPVRFDCRKGQEDFNSCSLMVRRMTFSFSIFGFCRFHLCSVLLPLTDSRDTVSSEESSEAAITSPVIQFIESSTMGDFEYRLEIITTFIIHLAFVNGNKNGELHHVDWNFGKDYLHQKILESKFNLAVTSKTCETDCLELITFRFLRQFASSLWLGSDSSKKFKRGCIMSICLMEDLC